MPDTYLDKSIVGFNADDDLRTKVDTYNRMSSILNPVDHPALTGKEPSLLRDNNPEEIAFPKTQAPEQKTLPNISISEALESSDATIRAYGKQAFESSYNAIPEFKYDLGRELETPYEESKKFLDKEFGFSKLRDNNEDFYYKNVYEKEGTLGHIALNPLRFLGRVVGQSVLKLGQGFGYMGSMLNPTNFGSNYMASVADNGFSRYLADAEENFKDKIIPVYKEAGFDEKGFFSKMGDASFWNDTVADGVAFMTSQMIDSAIMGNVGKIGLLGEIGSSAINTAGLLGRAGKVAGGIGKGIDAVAKFSTGAEDVAGMFGWARRIAGEAAFEASDGYKTVKDQLIEERKNGRNNLTDDQIEEQAGSQAAGRFRDNLLILGASGAFENKFIFQPLSRKLRGLAPHETPGNENILLNDVLEASAKTPKYTTRLGKFTNWKDPLGRIQFYGKRGLEATFMEGYWEENAQLASERMHNGKNTYDGFWSQLLGQTRDATLGNDKEVAESIGVGGIIGVLGGSVSAKAFGGKGIQGERRTEKADIKNQITNLNNAKDAFLSLNQIYKTKEDGSFEKDEDGNLVVDDTLAAARAKGISDFSKRMVQVDDIINPQLRTALRENLIADYTYAAIKAGIYDRAVDKFQNLPNHLDEIPGFTFDPNTVEDPLALAESFKAYKEIYDKIETSPISRPKDVSERDFQVDNEARKRLLYQMRGNERNATIGVNLAQDSVLAENDDPLNDSLVQEHNTLTFQEDSLKQFKGYIKGNDEFHKAHIEEQLDKIAARKKEIRESLKDKLDDNSLSDYKGLIVNEKKYAQHIDKTQQEISISNDFANQRTLGQLQARQEQTKFEGDQLANKSLGHENYIKYKNFITNVAKRDEAVDNATPPPSPPTATPAPITTTTTVVNTGTSSTASEVAKSEARRKAKDILNKLIENPEDADETQLALLKSDGIVLSELLNEAYQDILKTKPKADDFDHFIMALNAIYPSDDEDDVSDEVYNWLTKIKTDLKLDDDGNPIEDADKEVNDLIAKIPEDIRGIVVTDDNYKAWSNIGDKSDYKEFISQVLFGLSAFDKATPEQLAKLSKDDIDGMINTNKVFGNKNIREKVVDILYNKYYKAPIETEEEKKAKELQAKKDDIERRRKIELDSIEEVPEGKGIMGKLQNALLDGKFVHTTVVAASTGSKEFTVLTYSATREEAEKTINDKYDAELATLEGKLLHKYPMFFKAGNYTIVNQNPDGTYNVNDENHFTIKNVDNEFIERLLNPREEWNDIVPKDEYDLFINKNEVTQSRLKDIANKLIKNEKLSSAETAIFAGKTGEVNAIIKDIKDKEDKEAADKKAAEEEKRKKEEEEKRKKILEEANKDNQQKAADNNQINSMIDEARQKGQFTFVSVHLNEVEAVTDNKVILRTVSDENALRTHNVMRNSLREDGTVKRVKIIFQNEDSKKWFAIPNRQFPPSGPIAVIVDDKGEIIKYNIDGYPDENGQPVGFQYSINEYKPENVGKTRDAVMTKWPTLLPNGHGFESNNPIFALNVALNKGIDVFGKIDIVTNGLISGLNSDNTLGQNKGISTRRTMQDLINDGYLQGTPETLFSGQELYFVQGNNIPGNILGNSQFVKVGQAFIVDQKSGLVISFNGKKLRDLKHSDDNSGFSSIIAALDSNDGKIETNNPEEAELVYNFLRQVIYSENAVFQIDPTNLNNVLYAKNEGSTRSLADEQINFNYNAKNSFFDIADIHIPGEESAMDYLTFVRNNFETSSTPAQITNSEIRFEKINKRIIFTLDKNHKELAAAIDGIVKAPKLVNGQNPEAFVGKTFKTEKGNIMQVVSYDNEKGYTFKSGDIETTVSAEAFSKGFSKFEEIVKETPDPATLEQFENKGILSSISKEEKDKILLSDDNNLDDLDFSC